MPISSQATALFARLQRGIASAADLAHALGLSQPSISRLLTRLIGEGQVVRIGSRRGVRYGLSSAVEGIGSQWPLRRIDSAANIHELGTLYRLVADQYFFNPTPEARAAGYAWGGISEGIPYFLQDQRPGGFLGRAVPRHYPELHLPERVIDWTDEHYLRHLTQHGGDAVSDLILGDAAFNEHLSQMRHRKAIEATERSVSYPGLAAAVMEGKLPGSSAHGEHPKFTAFLRDKSLLRHILVKFSPTMDTAIGKRWGDLLTAEHHAHDILRETGLPACDSRIFTFENRTYLEVDRFDRRGAEGRIGVTSLLAIDATQYGKLDRWIDSAARLHKDHRIDAEALEQVRLAATFGALIANTDRHFGNLALYDSYDGHFALAPIYDMLPMLFAPEHDQIFARVFVPPDPSSDTLNAFGQARSLAERYWQNLADDARISGEFRAISATCLRTLEALPRTGAYASRP